MILSSERYWPTVNSGFWLLERRAREGEEVCKREGRQEHGVGDKHPKELVRNEIYYRVLSVLQPIVSLKPVFSMVFHS